MAVLKQLYGQEQFNKQKQKQVSISFKNPGYENNSGKSRKNFADSIRRQKELGETVDNS